MSINSTCRFAVTCSKCWRENSLAHYNPAAWAKPNQDERLCCQDQCRLHGMAPSFTSYTPAARWDGSFVHLLYPRCSLGRSSEPSHSLGVLSWSIRPG